MSKEKKYEINKKTNKGKLSNLLKEESKEQTENDKLDNFEINDIKDKIPELKNFDAISHFKKNIIYFDKNCSDCIKEKSFYCFTCKLSVCEECGVYDHKEHLLIPRNNCLNYDNTFFNVISKVIESGINLDNKKDQIQKDISKSIKELKNQLDIIEKNKLKEIDKFFDDIKNNYINLKKNYLKTKECIENYYRTNKNFFNIKIQKNKEDLENNKFEITNSIKKKKSGSKVNNMFDRYNYLKDVEIGDNKDIDNTIFIMNFELMNLCDNKNIDILKLSKEIGNKIKNISNIIEQTTNSMLEKFNNKYLFFDKNSQMPKFDDFYWDVKIRCDKFNENISKFKDTLYDIYKRNGSFDKLKDLLSFFDSKNNKGKDVLFNQQYFMQMNDLNNLNNENMAKIITKKLFHSLKRVRSTSKNKFNGQYSQTNSSFKKKEGNSRDKTLLNYKLRNRKGIDRYSYKTSINNSINSIKPMNITSIVPSHSINNELLTSFNKDNIILNQRVLQRFFAYFVLDFYSKYFKIINITEDENNYDNINDSENIYYQSNKLKNNGGSSGKKFNKNSKKYKGHNEELVKKKSKSVSLISNYTERYMNLKEKVKPLIGTNCIQFFEPKTNSITRIQLFLQKEIHGYNFFPDGCRHILVENKLYITGGTDNCGYPINIVLMFDTDTWEIQRIGNLNENHSYHSIEYLENFDSLIVIGGENSSSCEIMDIDGKRWTRLPSLNYPRANANIYYNNVTSDLFVLFGMEGRMDKKVKNTDVIEVLELNDIISGWMKVDYYKSVGLDIKISYCLTLPFTRDKLVIYGGSTARSLEKKIFALFDMIKNEIIKVDPKTMDLIKLEENKIRSFDKALEKIM